MIEDSICPYTLCAKAANVVYSSLIPGFLDYHCCVCIFVVVAYPVIFLLSVCSIMVTDFPPSVVTALHDQ